MPPRSRTCVLARAVPPASLGDRLTTARCPRNLVSDHFSCSIWPNTSGHDISASRLLQPDLDRERSCTTSPVAISTRWPYQDLAPSPPKWRIPGRSPCATDTRATLDEMCPDDHRYEQPPMPTSLMQPHGGISPRPTPASMPQSCKLPSISRSPATAPGRAASTTRTGATSATSNGTRRGPGARS